MKKKGRLLASCVYNNSLKEYETLLDLVREAETERDRKKSKVMEMVLMNFPVEFRQLALSFNDDVNETNQFIQSIQLSDGNWINLVDATVKQLQITMKIARGKITTPDVKKKIGIDHFDNNNFVKIRKQCLSTKMRVTYYRMVNNDFFSQERMHRFKMTISNKCTRCNSVETTKHLLWDCPESRNIWNLLNSILIDSNMNHEQICSYADIYKVTESSSVTHVKMKIIQEMIQIKRPSLWKKERLCEVIRSIMNTEKYIAVKNKTVHGWERKWRLNLQ